MGGEVRPWCWSTCGADVPKHDEPAEAVPPEVAAAIVDIFVYLVVLNLLVASSSSSRP
jgi:hypothetical protein